MDANLPGIVVTGASGFIGRHFVEEASGKYRLFCLARRSQKVAGIPQNKNIRWSQVDIADWDKLQEVSRCIMESGGADYIVHLAGYYDFNISPNPEYERTNVTGTRFVLQLGELLGIKRFIFSSSLAACEFPRSGQAIDENSPANGKFPYAWSKRLGEDMMKGFTDSFSVTILRLAAIYSDWCEYPPLYVFLRTWLSKKWDARMLGGKGESAVSYLHVRDLIKLIFVVIEKDHSLPRLATYNASPNGSTSHLELYKTATRYFFGKEIRPIQMPRPIAIVGLLAKQVFGKIIGKPPFERFWMGKYIDKKLNIDARKTQEELGWQPTPRYDILRRLLILFENMKAYPAVWNFKNEQALHRVERRPNLLIYDTLVKSREALVDEILACFLSPENRLKFPHYQEMGEDTLRWYVAFVYQLAMAIVRSGDRLLIRNYAEIIARQRYLENFDVHEVSNAFLTIGDIIAEHLNRIPSLSNLKQSIYDQIGITFQLAADVVEDYNDRFRGERSKAAENNGERILYPKNMDLERLLYELEDICHDVSEKEFISKTKEVFGKCPGKPN